MITLQKLKVIATEYGIDVSINSAQAARSTDDFIAGFISAEAEHIKALKKLSENIYKLENAASNEQTLVNIGFKAALGDMLNRGDT